ncbi:MAG: mechanosensitive ion channel family protein [Hydrococcus sp. Prado102]|jgi:small-conductance mechanosensitive channel|nr:mechanosensitive ion channel family protein [Hydrococcus sp. Prado102]
MALSKKINIFIAWALIAFLLITTSPQIYAQESTNADHTIDGIPVIFNGQTLFVVREKIGSFSPQERAEAITRRLEKIANDSSTDVDNLKIEEEKDNATSLVLDKQVIITITEADAQASREDRQELADEYRKQIRSSIEQYREDRQPSHIILGVVYTIVSTFVLVIIFLVLNKTFPKINRKLRSWQQTIIPSLRIQNIEIFSAAQITNLIIRFLAIARLVIFLGVLNLYIPAVLSFFPWTKSLGINVFGYFLAAINTIFNSIVGYFPNIFIVVLIVWIASFIIRSIKPIFTELERGTISWSGFYPDWAKPTYNLLLCLIIALAAVIAFPYLPGFDSPAFRGISVFLGILFSLGSSSAVANVVSGFILIYTRAFQVGDRVKISDSVGDIVEKTLLVTRLRTVKNVVVTIPNATVLGSNIINYSAAAREANAPPLILHTTITLGYDVPWRKVYQALIAAANATEHILKEPAPFVLQTSLDDFYVSYELNAYTDRPTMMARIYSELHQNIQDKCNEVGIEIMSPHYSAIRDGNQNTIPEDYLPKDYTIPNFRIHWLGNQSNKIEPPAGKE